MQRAWVVLLAGWLGCGFHSTAAGTGGGDDTGGMIDASMSSPGPGSDSASNQTCFSIKNTTYGIDWAACTTTSLDTAVTYTANTPIDTGSSTNPDGAGCVAFDLATNGKHDSSVCAIFRTSITVASGVTLSASGSRPLALFAHTIDIEGTIDVASHKGGQRGPNSNVTGCNTITAPTQSGGGGGGSFGTQGADGGDLMNAAGTGGKAAGSISDTSSFRGGCDGGAAGDGTPANAVPGGAGGGAVWLSSDMGMLTLGSSAVINASGAGAKAPNADKNGGPGGGAGGTIVVQSTTIQRNSNAQVYACGGGGAGGGQGSTDGGDATGVNGGTGGGNGNSNGDGGDGARGSNSDATAGSAGGQGGGGGGGGAGFVLAVSNNSLGTSNVYPNPLQLKP